MHYDLILEDGIVVTPEKSFNADIAVKDEKIAFIGKLNSNDTAHEIYDARGKHILPGIIDAHVHFRDPGLTGKEDFESGSIAAAFGGITSAADMPNVLPPTSTTERFLEKIRIAQEKSYVDFGLFALLVNDNTCEMEGLKKAGALGYKVFLGTSTGDIASPNMGTLFEQMTKSAALGMRLGFHAENSEINAHFTSKFKKVTDEKPGILFANARPVISEALAIQTVICYAQYTGAHVHIHHVTSKDGCLLIADAKQKGVNVTAETCPHYLLLDSSMEKAHRVYPPIREELHRKSLWEAIGNKTIDMLASDHAPHRACEKSLPIWELPAGLSGVETTVPLFLNEVNKGRLSINDFVRIASEAPAKIWSLYPKKGNLAAGADADFTVVDMNKKKKISAAESHSKSKTSAYDGMEVQGVPIATIIRGRFVMKDGELTGTKGFGKLVSPAL
ncbi:MAG: dihydroorotase family protein [Treponema sp.]|jgi:dihydroorotase|nr:dihydroorotase family protein [Treponema sp.]